MSRNVAFDALLAIGASIPPGGGATTWAETGRRLKAETQAQKPALFQVDGDTTTESRLGQLSIRKPQVHWVIMHDAGTDQSIEPSRYSADLVDAIEAKFNVDKGIKFETLGGNVYSAFIDGTIRRVPGDLDGTEWIIVPITLLIP